MYFYLRSLFVTAPLLPGSVVPHVVADAGDCEGGVPLHSLEAAEGSLGRVASVEEEVIDGVHRGTDGDEVCLRSDGTLGVVEEGGLPLDAGQHVDVTHDPVPDHGHC